MESLVHFHSEVSSWPPATEVLIIYLVYESWDMWVRNRGEGQARTVLLLLFCLITSCGSDRAVTTNDYNNVCLLHGDIFQGGFRYEMTHLLVCTYGLTFLFG